MNWSLFVTEITELFVSLYESPEKLGFASTIVMVLSPKLQVFTAVCPGIYVPTVNLTEIVFEFGHNALSLFLSFSERLKVYEPFPLTLSLTMR